MQKDNNTECSVHKAANMIVKAIEPTPIQRMRSVTQCKTVQPNNPELWNTVHNIYTFSTIIPKTHCTFWDLRVLTMEMSGAVYTGKNVKLKDSCYLHHKKRCKSRNTPKRRHTSIRLHDVTPRKTALFPKYLHYKNQLINAARAMLAASSTKPYCRLRGHTTIN
jgi:hypothetical protein